MQLSSQEYLSSNQLRERFGGVSHMWVERRLKNDPSFPRPIYIGRLRYWRLTDLETWEKSLIASSTKVA